MKAKLGKLGRFAGTKIAIAILVIVVIPLVMVSLVAHEPGFSPYDEFAHVDYLRRIEQGEIPNQGDFRTRASLRAEQCRGVPSVKDSTCPPADTARRTLLTLPSPGQGYSYEAQQPPLYYAVTAVFRLATEPFESNYVESARLTGIIWLSGGLAMLFWALRRLGAGHYASLLGCAVVAGSPAVLWQTGTVNNDAAAVVAGAAALLLYTFLREAKGVGPWVVGGVVAATCIWLKPTFFPVFLVIAVILAVGRWRTDRFWSLALRLGVLLGLPAASYFVWSAIYESKAKVPIERIIDALLPPSRQTHQFPWDDVLPSVERMLGLYDIKLAGGHLPIDDPAVKALAAVIGILLIAAGVSWLFRAGRASTGDQIGLVTVGALVLLGPTYVWLLFNQYGQDSGAHQRYGLVMLPGLVAAVALAASNRGRIVIGVLLAGLLTAEVLTLA